MDKFFDEQPQAQNKNEETSPSMYCFMAVNLTRNIIDALRENYVFRFNMNSKKPEYHRVNETEFRELTDIEFNSIKVDLNLKDITCSKDNLKTIIFSNQWEQYNPFEQFLKNLPEWDCQDHIAALAETVKTDDQEYWHWCLRKWIVGLIGSLADEETVNQTAIILCGEQGIGKSQWFKAILPPELRKYSSSGYLDPKDKESLVQLSELCLYNMDEVENLKPKNVEAIKELITKPSMYFRRAYTTLSNNYIRNCSFCGTANGINILHDITGNRRFLCHNVLSIDYKLKGMNLYQLYAQAYQLYRTGFQYWLDINEQKEVEKHNARYRATSPEEDLILTYFEPCNDGEEGAKRMQAHEIQVFLQRKVQYLRLSPINIGKVLSSKGFVAKKSRGISKWIVRERPQTDDESN